MGFSHVSEVIYSPRAYIEEEGSEFPQDPVPRVKLRIFPSPRAYIKRGSEFFQVPAPI